MKIPFYKYQGTGNDFILIDNRKKIFPSNAFQLIEKLCNRRFGIGADGLILLQLHNDADFYMQYFNCDGKESSMCGNGGRCIVQFANDLGLIASNTKFYAVDGYHEASIENNGIVNLLMKDVEVLEQRDQNNYLLNTGSPHFVLFLNDEIENIKIKEEAHKIRYNEEFKKQGINVNFLNVVNDETLKIRTYERGVEDETLSCGTGITASALAYAIFKNEKSGVCKYHLKSIGGELSVSFNFDSEKKKFSGIYLKGPTQKVFEGQFDL